MKTITASWTIDHGPHTCHRWNHIILYEFLNNNIVWRTDDPKIQQEKDNWLKGAPTILPIETYMKYIQGE